MFGQTPSVQIRKIDEQSILENEPSLIYAVHTEGTPNLSKNDSDKHNRFKIFKGRIYPQWYGMQPQKSAIQYFRNNDVYMDYDDLRGSNKQGTAHPCLRYLTNNLMAISMNISLNKIVNDFQ